MSNRSETVTQQDILLYMSGMLESGLGEAMSSNRMYGKIASTAAKSILSMVLIQSKGQMPPSLQRYLTDAKIPAISRLMRVGTAALLHAASADTDDGRVFRARFDQEAWNLSRMLQAHFDPRQAEGADH